MSSGKIISSLFVIFLSALFVSCTHHQSTEQVIPASRNISALMCLDLFSDKNEETEANKKNIVKDSVEKVTPQMMRDGFWNIIRGLSLNSNAKINLDSRGFTLDYYLNNESYLNFVYVYNTAQHEFVLSKVQITEDYSDPHIIVDKLSNYSEKQLSALLRTEYKIDDKKFEVKKSISYSDYELVRDEIPRLSLLTPHEIYQMSMLSPVARASKYQSLVRWRQIKSFAINTFVSEYVKKPVITTVLSMVTVYAAIHAGGFGKYIGLEQNTVPQWVAPSVVSMTVTQPKPVQDEVVLLMKTINSAGTIDAPQKELNEASGKNIKINETDFYTVRYSEKNKKTYFIVTHENDKGQLEVFYHEIDPERFPNLIKTALP